MTICGIKLTSFGDYSKEDLDYFRKTMEAKGISIGYPAMDYASLLQQQKYEYASMFFGELAKILKQRYKDGYAQLIALTQGIKDGVAVTALHHLSIIGMAASAWENAKANRPIDHTPPLQTVPKVEGERDFGLLEIT